MSNFLSILNKIPLNLQRCYELKAFNPMSTDLLLKIHFIFCVIHKLLMFTNRGIITSRIFSGTVVTQKALNMNYTDNIMLSKHF